MRRRRRSLVWLALVLGLAACAGSIVKTEKNRPLKPDEIKKMLRSDDFRKKNRAREQIEKLPEPDRLALLLELTHDDDSATRMLAVSELSKIKANPKAHAEIERVAAQDKDEDVRDVAKAVLEEEAAAKAPDGGPTASGAATPDAGS